MRRSVESAGPGRPGFTYLEVMVSLVVFGIALAGLGSIALAQLRIMRTLERRVYCQVPQGVSLAVSREGDVVGATITTLDPVLLSAESWARKLGAGAPLEAIAAGTAQLPTVVTSPSPMGQASSPLDAVNLVEVVEYPADGDSSAIRVAVTPIEIGP